MRAKYYHYRDYMNRPVVTQCLLINEENRVLAVGNSICSPMETPWKKFGRQQAYTRAMACLEAVEYDIYNEPERFIGPTALYVLANVNWSRYVHPHYTVFLHGYRV